MTVIFTEQFNRLNVEFGNTFALGNGTHNDAKIFGLDALNETAKTITFFASLDFL